jgi:hypothetical protein
MSVLITLFMAVLVTTLVLYLVNILQLDRKIKLIMQIMAIIISILYLLRTFLII